jgi:hypothetical protein
MPSRAILFLTAPILLLGWLDPAGAGVTQYFNMGTFQAALSSSTQITFDDPSLNLPDSLGNSYTIGAATFISTDGGGLFASGPNNGLAVNYGSPSNIIAADNGNGGGIQIALAPGFNALGMEIGDLFQGGQFSYQLNGPNGVLASGVLDVTDITQFNGPNTTFFGWVVDPGSIASLTILPTDISQFVAIDNVTFGTSVAQAIPEPSSLVLLASGSLVLAGLAGRRLFA